MKLIILDDIYKICPFCGLYSKSQGAIIHHVIKVHDSEPDYLDFLHYYCQTHTLHKLLLSMYEKGQIDHPTLVRYYK